SHTYNSPIDLFHDLLKLIVKNKILIVLKKEELELPVGTICRGLLWLFFNNRLLKLLRFLKKKKRNS
ncbi:hypothetical protein, partial [Saccharophagus degradans]